MKPNNMVVRCPHCDNQFRTHDVGDMRVCIHCGEKFKTFDNVVDE